MLVATKPETAGSAQVTHLSTEGTGADDCEWNPIALSGVASCVDANGMLTKSVSRVRMLSSQGRADADPRRAMAKNGALFVKARQ